MRFFSNTHFILYALPTILVGLTGAAPLGPEVVDTAGGSPPNSKLPAIVTAAAIKELQLALFLENLEAAFFKKGVSNITKWGATEFPNDTLKLINRTAAQELVHVATLTTTLNSYNETLIQPCGYTFPSVSTKEFLELARLIESVGIGAIIGISERLALTDPLFLKSVSSILTIESRHDAFYRRLLGAAPYPSPFDTGISDIWAYNLALAFVVPGSCPVELPLPILPRLTMSQLNNSVSQDASKYMHQVEFSWDPTQTPFLNEAGKQLMIGWVNQLNLPVYSVLNITGKGKGIASLPPDLKGVAFAVITVQQPDNVRDLSLATLAGPVVVPIS